MKSISPQPAERHEQVVSALRRMVRAIDLHSRYLVRAAGISGPQLVVLRIIAREGRASAGEVAEAAALSQATISTILDRLEARGLVQRQRGREDKRKVYVSLSAEGEAVLAKAPQLLQEHFLARFQALPEAEQESLAGVLRRVAEMMEPGGAIAGDAVAFAELQGLGADPGAAKPGAGRRRLGP